MFPSVRDQLKKVGVKAHAGRTGIQVQHTENFVLHFERNRHDRMDTPRDQTLGFPVALVALTSFDRIARRSSSTRFRDRLAGVNLRVRSLAVDRGQ